MIISYAQNYEDVMLWRALSWVEGGFYIDVGANDPSADSVTRLFYDRDWHGINIEPLSLHVADLQRERPRDINLCCAAGAVAGEIELWESDVRGWATADREAIEAHVAQGDTGHFTLVPVLTLSTICEKHAPSDIHFLKIDVEGFEQAVLEGMDFERFRPWLVVIEATRPNSSEEIHGQWEHLLTDARYSFVYGDGLNRFYLAQEHAELATRFRYPPNVFDAFVKYAQIEPEARAVLAEQHAAEAEARATLSRKHAAEAEARATEAATRVVMAEIRIAQSDERTASANARAEKVSARAAHAEASAASATARNSALMSSLSWRVTAPLRRLLDLAHDIRAGNWRSSMKQLGMSGGMRHGEKARIPRELLHLSPSVRQIYTDLKAAIATNGHLEALPIAPGKRPRLAFVSPLPPERSGIADYSVALLPALARFYEIDVIVTQDRVSTPWVTEHCGVHTPDWLLENAHLFDRVLYHFGNSSYHQHMFDLLARVPGVVVLHDFFLGDIQNYLEVHAHHPDAFTRALYTSHGYGAVGERMGSEHAAKVVSKYPANLDVLQMAQGVIVHSQYSRQLARDWYGAAFPDDWSVIALLRTPELQSNRAMARQALGFKEHDFLVCSFGILGLAKLNHRLLEAWLGSHLAKDTACHLVFVGEEHDVGYGEQLRQSIAASGLGERVQITGWADTETFQNYLAGADMAVQLRAFSRGETSAAVLDCMNHALPTIVNAQGAFAELPADAVWMLPENFENEQLTEALEMLWQDGGRRIELGQRARQEIERHHGPDICAQQYFEAIELSNQSAQERGNGLARAMTRLAGRIPSEAECKALAQSIHEEKSGKRASGQLLVDVSATCRNDLKTGIQRVVRALVWGLVQAPPTGFRVEPVYLTDDGGVWHYRYARRWTSGALGFSGEWMEDEPVDFWPDDALLVADFTSAFAVEAERCGLFGALKDRGIGLHFFVYDLLPIQMPEFFPPGQFGFGEWLGVLARVADSATCISRAVADDLTTWMSTSRPDRLEPLHIDWFHLGADIENSIPTTGFPDDAEKVLSKIYKKPSFLMVGTIEPRKGHLQTIEAFTQFWKDGLDVNLVIVGREGWHGLPDEVRRTIPKIVAQLRSHPELGKRLIWLEGITDGYLEKVYAACTCLLAASEGEGFGLPLIEAAQKNIAIIARDIPIFREVAGVHAYYFDGLAPDALAQAIKDWLRLAAVKQVPRSSDMPWMTWKQSVASLVEKLNLPPSKTSN
jgi:FkbM family methyltransferase